jgi:hypothetical protein
VPRSVNCTSPPSCDRLDDLNKPRLAPPQMSSKNVRRIGGNMTTGSSGTKREVKTMLTWPRGIYLPFPSKPPVTWLPSTKMVKYIDLKILKLFEPPWVGKVVSVCRLYICVHVCMDRCAPERLNGFPAYLVFKRFPSSVGARLGLLDHTLVCV